MKTWILLENEIQTSFCLDSTMWERKVGDVMNIEGKNWRIVFIFDSKEDALAVWNEIVKRRNSEMRRRRKEEERIGNLFLAKIVMEGAERMGIDKEDADYFINEFLKV